jgi:hypothetical protein
MSRDMKSFETLSEAMADLKKRGFEHDFNLRDKHIESASGKIQLSPEQFEITEVYRFEGNTDPGDELVLYAIESHGGVKGLLVNAYGPYSNTASDELVAKLNVLR